VTAFAYFAITREPGTGLADGMLITPASAPRTRGVIWDHVDRRWSARPGLATALLSDPRYAGRVVAVDRPRAELIARERFGVELPAEAELHHIVSDPVASLEWTPAPGGAGPDLDNEDWLRGMAWDLPYTTLRELWSGLGMTAPSSDDERRAALEDFVRLPVWRSAPVGLRIEVEAFLRASR
jgi:hypothetical protein